MNELREQRGITWYRLGRDAGFSTTNASAYYFERHEPKANLLAALADALGCSIDDLFEEQPDSSQQEKKSSASGRKTQNMNTSHSKAAKPKKR